jgi:DNA-binding LacI/PurR family transcriptional regulator
MKLENITIKDIAKALDLSYSTVSRALKGSHKISGETIQKVKAYADAHHYRPNLMAQSLKNKSSRCIGVVLCSIPNSFFAEVTSGIESVAHSKDYLVIITQNLESHEREIRNLEHLTWRSVDGLLVSLAAETDDISHFSRLHDQGLPMVFFDRVTDKIHTHRVVSDNAGGAYQATRHLIEQGYKHIAHVTSNVHMSITKERLEGYKKALADHGIPCNEDYVKYCPHGGMVVEEMETAIHALLSMPVPPDALFGASDRITLGCFSILEKRGYRIPGEIALAGFSNFSSPELFNPSLTTVKQAAFEMGKRATELLIQLIESKRVVTTFEEIVLPTELMVRKSTIRAV